MTAYETTTSRLVQQELGACALIQDLLPLYIEGEVTPASRDLIAEHLARCERCTGFMAGARSVRDQLRRESAQRESSVAHDHAARQAVVTGQRRLMALVLGVFGMLFLAMGATAIAFTFFRSSPDAVGVPAAMPAVDAPIPWSDAGLPEAELHRRAMEEAGLLYWDPQTNQFIEQNPAGFPAAFPTATPVPAQFPTVPPPTVVPRP
jgi:hypothetical protein